MYVTLWLPDYDALSDESSFWLQDEFASYEDVNKRIHPRTQQPLNYRIAWLSQKARLTITASVNTLASQLEAGIISRKECAQELVRLNPLAMRIDRLLVAVLDENTLNAQVHQSVRWMDMPLLYHKGYRQAFLNIISMSRVGEGNSYAEHFYMFLHQWLLVIFGGTLSDASYHATQQIVRATPLDFYNIALEKDVIHGRSLFTWNRPHRAVADKLLSLLWDEMGVMVSYMEKNSKHIMREYKQSINVNILTQFIKSYRTGSIFIYEWFGEPDLALAWSLPSMQTEKYHIGYGIQLRSTMVYDDMFCSLSSLRATMLHEISHTFDTLSDNEHIKYPLDYYKQNESTMHILDYGHSPTFVNAFAVIISIAERSGIVFPPGVTRTVRIFEDYADALIETSIYAGVIRLDLGMEQEDETYAQRERDYDTLYKDTEDALIEDVEMPSFYYKNNNLIVAIQQENLELIEYIISDTQIDIQNAVDPPMLVFWTQNYEMLEFLLTKPRTVELLSETSLYDILYSVIKKRNTKMGKLMLLVIKRINPAIYDNDPLICAIDCGATNVVRALLNDPRVDPAARDNHTLISACEQGFFSIVEMLLQDARVDPKAQNSRALTAAVATHRSEIECLLIADGRVDVSVIDVMPEYYVEINLFC